MVSKELLRPLVHLVYVPSVLKNLLYYKTVAKPEEVLPNQVLAPDTDSPMSSGCFANKGIVVLLAFKAPARVKFDCPQTFAFQSSIKITILILMET
jgi:hypothetical protein